MTITDKQRQRYSVLTSMLPVTATTMLLIASLIERPFTDSPSWALELLALAIALVLFLIVVGRVTYIRKKANSSEADKKLFATNLVGFILILVVSIVAAVVGLVLDPIIGAFVSLITGLAAAEATVRFLALPSGEEAQPADNQVPRSTT